MKGKRQNQLSEDNIQKIIHTYQHRTEETCYAHRVELAEPERSGDRPHTMQPEG